MKYLSPGISIRVFWKPSITTLKNMLLRKKI